MWHTALQLGHFFLFLRRVLTKQGRQKLWPQGVVRGSQSSCRQIGHSNKEWCKFATTSVVPANTTGTAGISSESAMSGVESVFEDCIVVSVGGKDIVSLLRRNGFTPDSLVLCCVLQSKMTTPARRRLMRDFKRLQTGMMPISKFNFLCGGVKYLYQIRHLESAALRLWTT
jgi:hypothetical protein